MHTHMICTDGARSLKSDTTRAFRRGLTPSMWRFYNLLRGKAASSNAGVKPRLMFSRT